MSPLTITSLPVYGTTVRVSAQMLDEMSDQDFAALVFGPMVNEFRANKNKEAFMLSLFVRWAAETKNEWDAWQAAEG
jgi:hypothetical protein